MIGTRQVHQIAGIAILSIAAALIYASLSLRYYTAIGPGPGFFPFWVSVALAGLAVLMVVQATFAPTEPLADGFIANRAGYLRILAVLGALVATAFFLDGLGFALTMFLMNIFILHILGSRSLIGNLAVAVAGSFLVSYVFTRWLKVPLPTGFFGL